METLKPTFEQQDIGLPSGYERVEQLAEKITVDSDILPWIDEPKELSVARCVMQSGAEFYLASAVGTNGRLTKAADALNEHQQRNADNMLYSRLPDFMENFYSSSVDTMRTQTTAFPVYVARNKAGQRAYFTTPEVEINGEPQRIALRLAVCDKNKQEEVLKVIDPKGDKKKMGKVR